MHYICQFGCCEVEKGEKPDVYGHPIPFRLNGETFPSRKALADHIGLTVGGLDGRLTRHGCLLESKAEAHQRSHGEFADYVEKSIADPVCCRFLRLVW